MQGKFSASAAHDDTVTITLCSHCIPRDDTVVDWLPGFTIHCSTSPAFSSLSLCLSCLQDASSLLIADVAAHQAVVQRRLAVRRRRMLLQLADCQALTCPPLQARTATLTHATVAEPAQSHNNAGAPALAHCSPPAPSHSSTGLDCPLGPSHASTGGEREQQQQQQQQQRARVGGGAGAAAGSRGRGRAREGGGEPCGAEQGTTGGRSDRRGSGSPRERDWGGGEGGIHGQVEREEHEKEEGGGRCRQT